MKILIVDDNQDFASTIADIARTGGWESHCLFSPESALDYLAENHTDVSLLLLDIEFTTSSSLNGLDVLERSVKKYPLIPVVMISGKGTIEAAVRATKLGAINFIEKSLLSHDKLQAVLSSAMQRVNSQLQNRELLKIIEAQGIIGKSRAMAEVADKIIRYGRTDLNVLLTGETGTGKKLVANAIHAISKRAKYSIVTVDIPNIPRELFQTELFGHMKGSFSFAFENKKGLFHQANRGTLFFDEIGDLSSDLQANLLLPLESKFVRRVGATETEPVDIRFVSATDRDLVSAMTEGSFREQLYHRLRECEIHMPGLHDRREDIPPITEFYLEKHNRELEDNKQISSAAIEYLQERNWKGNVRELASVMKVVLQTSSSQVLEITDFHRVVATPLTSVHPVSNNGGYAFSLDRSLKDDLAIADKLKIAKTLEMCKGNVSKTAAVLGISRETLHNKIRRYGIDTHSYRTKIPQA